MYIYPNVYFIEHSHIDTYYAVRLKSFIIIFLMNFLKNIRHKKQHFIFIRYYRYLYLWCIYILTIAFLSSKIFVYLHAARFAYVGPKMFSTTIYYSSYLWRCKRNSLERPKMVVFTDCREFMRVIDEKNYRFPISLIELTMDLPIPIIVFFYLD